MDYISALTLLHDKLRPINYLEIGCRQGLSLSLSKAPSIGIDPDYEIKNGLAAPARLFKMTSDDFFAQQDVGHLLQAPIDFAFIDGMHVVEFALRDFMNIEKYASSTGVIAIDDVLPQSMEYATRERNTQIWCGDVYRLILILRHYRPDLSINIYDIEMKGIAVVSGLNPLSRVLSDNYKKISQELDAGQWSCPSVKAIRDELQTLAPSKLARDVQALADARPNSQPGGKPVGDGSLYLELLKRSILNEIYLDNELRIHYLREFSAGKNSFTRFLQSCLGAKKSFSYEVLHDIKRARSADYEKLAESRKIGRFFERRIDSLGFSHSMMGRLRMDNLHFAMDVVRNEQIPGDVIECGVWRGGGCIFMAGYLHAHKMDRRVFVADSFEGLPSPTLPQDAGLDLSKEKFPELAVSLATVKENFAAYDLDKSNVFYLKGWFKDTLPNAAVDQIALLRMDGDLYESTMDILNALYDKVAPGGVVIVDDFYAVPPCQKAVEDFFEQRGLALPKMTVIDWTGVWFRKAGVTQPVPAV